MLTVTNAQRVVFPAIGRTKGEVVAYYERVAERALPWLLERPLSIRRYPKGLAGPGFFQKNVPKHYPATFGRFDFPRSDGEVTSYPVVREAAHLPYLANQGALELHVTTSRISDVTHPDRVVIDLDPPDGAVDLVRRAAFATRDLLAELGLDVAPLATGSKGYHLVADIEPNMPNDVVASALHRTAALLAKHHEDILTIAFRTAARGKRVFVDWLRNRTMATVVAPYSLRARPKASIATPLAWDEVERVAPDAFTIADVDRLLDRPAVTIERVDARPFVAAVNAAFEAAGIVLEKFDRFRS